MREVAAEAKNPVMLYSIGKDSAVMLHLALKAFYPFQAAVPAAARRYHLEVPRHDRFRDSREGKRAGPDRHINEEGVKRASTRSRPRVGQHTDMMKTESLKQALDKYGFDAAFGGARRDEEKSAPRSASSRSAPPHRWDPKNQRPELWRLYNTRKAKGESIRVFPLSNWTELDIWQYIHLENIDIVPLYFRRRTPGGRTRRHADHGR
jgi:sulfate adenylyltransferase subunit 2